ncbi:hypothetical protein [Levilactobacillus bambusae]|uniref:Uncharacterized protein n=1 Tax=Levilactobacillus bambusae TaxID=2024736 RepID=A0A2V1MXC7_9LACO|nr:hypothetical protein [Levilactobacillus bambusae]PWF99472.1 hypothetical protein DCM90_08465 [Levilactobacillus bambusae]
MLKQIDQGHEREAFKQVVNVAKGYGAKVVDRTSLRHFNDAVNEERAIIAEARQRHQRASLQSVE